MFNVVKKERSIAHKKFNITDYSALQTYSKKTDRRSLAMYRYRLNDVPK